MTTEITVPVRILVLKDSIADLLNLLSHLDVNSNSFKTLNKYILSMTLEMTRFEAMTSRSFGSLNLFNKANKSVEKMEDTLAKARIAMNDIKFPDLKLSNSLLKEWDSLNEALDNATKKFDAVKERMKHQILGDAETSRLFENIDPKAMDKSYDLLFSLIENRTQKVGKKLAESKDKLDDFLIKKNSAHQRGSLLASEGFTPESLGDAAFNKFFTKAASGALLFKNIPGQEKGAAHKAFVDFLKSEYSLGDKETNELLKYTTAPTLNNYVKKLGKQSNMFTRGWDAANFDQLHALEQQVKDVEAAYNKYQEVMNKFTDASFTGDLTKAAGEVGEAYNKLLQELGKLDSLMTTFKENALKGFKLGDILQSFSAYLNELNNFKNTLATTNAEFLKLEQTKRTFSNMKMAISNFMGFYLVLNLTKRGVKEAMTHIKELDSVMNKISIVTDKSTSDLWGLVDAYSDMAQKYGVSIKGAYEVSLIYYQQGLDTSDVLTLTNETLKLSKISGLDYATTTDYMTTAMRGFKMETSDASRVVDVYSNLAAHTAVSLGELAVGMSKTASSLESVGASFEESSAMIATMVAVTRESSTNIGSAMKSIASRYGEMKKDMSAAFDAEGEELSYNKVDAALQSVGISLKDSSGQFRNMTDVIIELGEQWDTLDSVQQRYIATQFAGNRQQSRFLALVSNVDLLKSNLNYALDSENVGDVLALKALDSIESRTEQLKVAYQLMYTTIGAEDMWKGALSGLTNFMNTLNGMPKLFDKIPIGAASMLYDVVNVIRSVGNKALEGVSSGILSGLMNDKDLAQLAASFMSRVNLNLEEELKKQEPKTKEIGAKTANTMSEGAEDALKDENLPAAKPLELEKVSEPAKLEALEAIKKEEIKAVIEQPTQVPVELVPNKEPLVEATKEATELGMQEALVPLETSGAIADLLKDLEVTSQLAELTKEVKVDVTANIAPAEAAIQSLDGKTVTVNVNANTPDLAVSGGRFGNGAPGGAYATGTKKLLGELGPEMYVTNGHYYVAGTNGPEMIDLPDDAIVFNHLLTEDLLKKNLTGTNGKPVTTERKAVAMAGGNLDIDDIRTLVDKVLSALTTLSTSISETAKTVETSSENIESNLSLQLKAYELSSDVARSNELGQIGFNLNNLDSGTWILNTSFKEEWERKKLEEEARNAERRAKEEDYASRRIRGLQVMVLDDDILAGPKKRSAEQERLLFAGSLKELNRENRETWFPLEKTESSAQLLNSFVDELQKLNEAKLEEQKIDLASASLEKSRLELLQRVLELRAAIKTNPENVEKLKEERNSLYESLGDVNAKTANADIARKIAKEQKNNVTESIQESVETTTSIKDLGASLGEVFDLTSGEVMDTAGIDNLLSSLLLMGTITEDLKNNLSLMFATEPVEKFIEAYNEITKTNGAIADANKEMEVPSIKYDTPQLLLMDFDNLGPDNTIMTPLLIDSDLTTENISETVELVLGQLAMDFKPIDIKFNWPKDELEENITETSNKLEKFKDTFKSLFTNNGNLGLGGNKLLGGKLSQWGSGINMLAGMIPNETREGLMLKGGVMAGAGLMKTVGGIASGSPMAIATGIMSIWNGINEFIETDEERLKSLTKHTEDLANQEKQEKANYKSLLNSINKLDELKQKRNESTEAAEEYLNAVNDIADKFPELISSFDALGNATLDVTSVENALTDARERSVNASLKAAEAEKDLREEELKQSKTKISNAAKLLKEGISSLIEEFAMAANGEDRGTYINTKSFLTSAGLNAADWSLAATALEENLDLTDSTNADEFLGMVGRMALTLASDKDHTKWNLLPSSILDYFYLAMLTEEGGLDATKLSYVEGYEGLYLTPDNSELGLKIEALKSLDYSEMATEAVDELTKLATIASEMETALGDNDYTTAREKYKKFKKATTDTSNLLVIDWVNNQKEYIADLALTFSDYALIEAKDTAAARKLLASDIASDFSDTNFVKANSAIVTAMANNYLAVWASDEGLKNADHRQFWTSLSNELELAVKGVSTFWDSLEALGSDEVERFEGYVEDLDNVRLLDLLSIYGSLDGWDTILNILSKGIERNSESMLNSLTTYANSLEKTYGDKLIVSPEYLNAWKTAITSVQTTNDLTFMRALINLAEKLNTEGYEVDANEFMLTGLSILSDLDLSDTSREIYKLFMDSFTNNGLKTREGILKIIDQLKDENDEGQYDGYIASLESMLSNLRENIRLAADAMASEYTHNWSEKSKTLSNLTSGVEIQDVDLTITSSKGKIKFEDFITDNGKLTLPSEKANEYWDFLEQEEKNKALKLRDEVNTAEKNLTRDGKKTAKEISKWANYDSEYRQWLDTIGFDVTSFLEETAPGSGIYKKKVEITPEEFEAEYNRAITDTTTSLNYLDLYIEWGFNLLRQTVQWNKGDYSSLLKTFTSHGIENYTARLKELAGGARYEDWELDEPDIKNAVDKMTDGYSSFLSDVLEKGTENINIKQYEGILQGDASRIANQLSADMDVSDFVSQYYQAAGWTIEEANSKIIEANRKVREKSYDEVKELSNISKAGQLLDLTYTTLQLDKEYLKNLKAKQKELNFAKHIRSNSTIGANYTKKLEEELLELTQNNPIEQLADKLKEAGAILENGILTLTSKANMSAIADALAEASKQVGSGMAAELMDMAQDILKKYIDYINSSIEGKSTYTEATDLMRYAKINGATLDEDAFYQTAEGLKLSNDAAIQLYSTLDNVSAVLKSIVFDSLTKLLKENNKHYKSTASILARIGELNKLINDITEDANESHLKLKKTLEEERDIASLMASNSYTSPNGEWDFSNGGFTQGEITNVATYYATWAKYMQSMSLWATTGRVDYTGFTDLIAHVSQMAKATQQDINFMGKLFTKDGLIGGMRLDLMQRLMASALRADKNGPFYDKSVLSSLGFSFTNGNAAMSNMYGFIDQFIGISAADVKPWNTIMEAFMGIDDAMKASAKHKTADSFFGKDGIFDLGEFKSFLKDNKLTDKWNEFADNFYIGNEKLSDIFNNSDKFEANKDKYSKAMKGIFQMLLDEEGWDVNNPLQSMALQMERFGLEEGSYKFGDKTIHVKKGKVLIQVDDEEGGSEYTDSNGNTVSATSPEEAIGKLNKIQADLLKKLGKEFGANIDESKTGYDIDFKSGKRTIHVEYDGDTVVVTDSEGNEYDNVQLALDKAYEDFGNGMEKSEWYQSEGFQLDLDSTGLSIFKAFTGQSGEIIGKTFGEAIKSAMQLDNGEPITIPVEIDPASLANLSNPENPITIPVKIDPNLFNTDIGNMEKPKPVEVTVTAQVTQALADINGIKRAEPVDVTADAQVETAQGDINGILRENPVDVTTLADIEPAKTAIDGITPAGPVIVKVKLEVDDTDLNKFEIESNEGGIVTFKAPEELEPAPGAISPDEVTTHTVEENIVIGDVEELPDLTAEGTVNYTNSVTPLEPQTATGTVYWTHESVNSPPTGGEGPTGAKGRSNHEFIVGNAHAKSTLMGELGPEMVVSNNRYFVVGQNGPEFVDLADDAIVFNHLQTRLLLEKGTSNTRGKAITNERTAVAYAQGSRHGGKAHEKTTATDPDEFPRADKALKGKGGNGEADAIEGLIKALDKWYNLLQELAKILAKLNKEEALRAKIQSDLNKSGKEYYESLKRSIEQLKKEVETSKLLVEELKAEREKRTKELKRAPFGKMYETDEDGQVKMKTKFKKEYDKYFDDTDTGKPKKTVKQQYEWLKKQFGAKALEYDSNGKQIKLTGDKEKDLAAMKTAVEAALKRMEAQKDEVQGLTDSINEHEKAILEAQEKENELLQAMRDNQISVEDSVLEAIVDMREREIEDQEELRNAIEESTNKFIDGLSNALDQERKMYEMEDKESDLRSKQRQLAVLQRTGGSGSEVASLESEIENALRDLYFDKQQELIDAIKEASDKELERMDMEIDIMKELLEYEKEHGLLWDLVYEVMKLDAATIADFVINNNSEWWGNSAIANEKNLADAIFNSEQWQAYRDDKEAELEGGEEGTEEGEKKVKGDKKAGKKTKYQVTYTDSKGKTKTRYFNTKEEALAFKKEHEGAKLSKYKKSTTEEPQKTARGYWWNGKYYPTAALANAAKNEMKKKLASDTTLTADERKLMEQDIKKTILPQYREGGLADKTGPAILHGTKSKPEAIFNARLTSILRNKILANKPNSLLNLLSEFLTTASKMANGSTYNSIDRSAATSIGSMAVNMNVKEIANDYDAKRAGELAMEEMLRIARKTNVTSLRR